MSALLPVQTAQSDVDAPIGRLGYHGFFRRVLVHRSASLPGSAMIVAEHCERKFYLAPLGRPSHGPGTGVAPSGHQQAAIAELDTMPWSRPAILPRFVLRLTCYFTPLAPSDPFVAAVLR